VTVRAMIFSLGRFGLVPGDASTNVGPRTGNSMAWIYTANRRLSRVELLPAVTCSPAGRLWGRPTLLVRKHLFLSTSATFRSQPITLGR
jgi:hypothetical protein